MSERNQVVAQPGAALASAAQSALDGGRLLACRAMIEAARARGNARDAIDELEIRLLLAEGQPATAIDLADRAIAAAPSSWALRCLRADAKLGASDTAGAALDAAEALHLAPTETLPKAVLGAAMLMLGRLADAHACLKEAVAASPRHVGYRLALARTLAGEGEPGLALGLIEEGIAAQPESGPLHIAAMRLCISLQRFQQAVGLADAAGTHGLFDPCVLGLRGHALSCLGRDREAAHAYHAALQLSPEDAYVRHLVAAAGLIAQPTRASPDYVRVLFDGFASHFEVDLVELDYRAPGLIRAALLDTVLLDQVSGLDDFNGDPDASASPGNPAVRLGPVLDLGCGTGLVGLVLADLGLGPFTGIDLSPSMLAEAATKNVYAELIEGDLRGSELPHGPFELAVAADVLPYLGDPSPVFAAVRTRLTAGARFVLTAEALDEAEPAEFCLGARARYAHRPSALRAAANSAGFDVESCRTAFLRRDRDEDVQGCVLVTRKSSAGNCLDAGG